LRGLIILNFLTFILSSDTFEIAVVSVTKVTSFTYGTSGPLIVCAEISLVLNNDLNVSMLCYNDIFPV